MDFEQKITDLLEKNLSERAFKLWVGINEKLPNIWEKPTSSTGKYHKRQDGSIPNQGEHTYEMLYCASKIMRMFNAEPKSGDADAILLAVVLHDALKYGTDGNERYSLREHDQMIGDMLEENRSTFQQILNEDQVNELIDSARYHSGQWSTDAQDGTDFNFQDLTPKAMFVHMLDMLSTADCLKFY